MYRILSNKGAGRFSKVTSDIVARKLGFWAFQRWFLIENRTIIKETVHGLDIYDRFGFPQTMGAPLLGDAPLIGRIRYRPCQVNLPPCFYISLHPKWFSKDLSFSPIVRNFFSLLNLKFRPIQLSGSIFRAKSCFLQGPKYAKKWRSPANFKISPYNSIEMSKNQTQGIVKSRLLPGRT